jgi:hypothetical protein
LKLKKVIYFLKKGEREMRETFTATVEILEGKHSRPAPAGTKELFELLFRKSGFKDGDFKILLGRQIRGACGAKKMMVHNLDEQTGTIMIKAQINGKKDQRFEFFLTLPNQQKPKFFLKSLKKGAYLINNPPEIQPVKKDEEDVLQIQKVEKEKISQRAPRGVGFKHFIADEESVYLFWLEIRELFGNDKKMTTRKEFTDNFLINYGHSSSCYRFISKLVQLKILSEVKIFSGNKKNLVVGENLSKIIDEIEKDSVEEKKPNTFAEKIDRLQLLKDKYNKIIKRQREITLSLDNLRKEYEELSLKTTTEMQEAEKKLKALKKILG